MNKVQPYYARGFARLKMAKNGIFDIPMQLLDRFRLREYRFSQGSGAISTLRRLLNEENQFIHNYFSFYIAQVVMDILCS
jgi:hypothetical protein